MNNAGKAGLKKLLPAVIFVHILYLILFYVVMRYLHISGRAITSLSEISGDNFAPQLLQHMAVTLLFPLVVIFIQRLRPSDIGLTRESGLLCGILLAAYIICFLLHGDFSYSGVYNAIYLLLSVALGEELFFRGWSYMRLRQESRLVAVIISGFFFGIMHAVYPGILAGDGVGEILLSMPNHIGGGIAGGLLFVALLELSGTLFVPVLVHALLDYPYGYSGLAACIFAFVFLWIGRLRKRRA